MRSMPCAPPAHPFARAPLLALVPVLAAALACGDSSTPTSPAQGNALVLTPVDSGFDFSIFLTAPPNDPTRVLVVERGGRILLRKNGVRQDSAFLNLTALTSPSTGEYGVYSVAFHPQYAANRRLFVYYADLNGDAQLAEFQADQSFDHADPASIRPLLSQSMPGTAVLYGGMLAFGPDGKLYLGTGDAVVNAQPGSGAQDSTSLLGKMLRLDVDQGDPYGVPADNPFVARAGWRGEIWQLGLRNPWRWSFDRENGDLWIADVGEHQMEEIDRVAGPPVGGENFGWPIMEGTACYQAGCSAAGLVPPLLTYTHSPACAITGGYVYRGAAFPALRGTYFYGDYCGGWVRSVRRVGSALVEAYTPLSAPLINDNVVSFGEDAEGEIYVVMASGRVYRIELASAAS